VSPRNPFGRRARPGRAGFARAAVITALVAATTLTSLAWAIPASTVGSSRHHAALGTVTPDGFGGGSLLPAGQGGGPREAPAIGPASTPPAPTYTLTFNESGLPSGSNWSVTLNGTATTVPGTLSLSANPWGLLYDPLNNELYIMNLTASHVTAINATTHATVAVFAVGTYPRFAALDPENGYVYVTNTFSNNVSVVNGSTDKVVGSIPVGPNPIGVAFDGSEDRLFVTDSEAYTNPSHLSNVTVINTTTETSVGSIPVGYDSRAVTYDPLNGLLYVENYGSDNLTIVNASTDALVGSIAIGAPCSAPAVDPSNGYLYVGENTPAGLEAVIDPVTDHLVASIPVGSYPSAPVFDPANGYVYDANEFSDNVSVINTTTNTVQGSIPAGVYPAASAVDGATGVVYVANWQSSSLTEIDGAAPSGGAPVVVPPSSVFNVTFGSSGSVRFAVAHGTYSYSASSTVAYAADPESGVLTVSGAGAVTVVPFRPGFAVAFTEVGLPPGTLWTVTLNGSPQNSTHGALEFVLGNGTYGYTVSSANTKFAGTRGNLTVNGTGITVALTFELVRYQVAFQETGLAPGVPWLTFLVGAPAGEFVCIDDHCSAPLGEPNGTYRYDVDSPPGYNATGGSGLLTVQGAPVTVTIAFALQAGRHFVGFVESGLPAGADWYVALYLLNESASYRFASYGLEAPSLVVAVPNGTYGFVIGDNATAGLTPSPAYGTLLVAGANVTEALTFLPGYEVSFEVNGLAPGTEWFVNVTGGASYASASVFLAFGEPNGNYTFTSASANASYAPPRGGSFRVNGTGANLAVDFTYVTYAVTFNGTGLPPGKVWWVTLGGTPGLGESSPLEHPVVSAANGTYAYTIFGPVGYRVVGLPASGNITVHGSPVTESLSFVAGTTYSVTFHPRGVPLGRSLCVTLGGEQLCSFFDRPFSFTGLSPGAYRYVIAPIPGGPTTPRLGGARLPTSGYLVVSDRSLAVGVTFVHLYRVALVETGLPQGTLWRARVGATLLTSTGTTISLELGNGVYPFRVSTVAGDSLSPTYGWLVVRGANATVALHAYLVTFTESGLGAGKTWCVRIGTGLECSSSTSISFYEGNGTHVFALRAVAGYVLVGPSRTFVVAGAAVAVSVSFSPAA
jgi:YVTN family beta-propeller protein